MWIPIQQAISALFPQHSAWWFNLLLALLVTVAVAHFSWRVAEIKQHPLLKRLERRWICVNDGILRLCSGPLPPGLGTWRAYSRADPAPRPVAPTPRRRQAAPQRLGHDSG